MTTEDPLAQNPALIARALRAHPIATTALLILTNDTARDIATDAIESILDALPPEDNRHWFTDDR